MNGQMSNISKEGASENVDSEAVAADLAAFTPSSRLRAIQDVQVGGWGPLEQSHSEHQRNLMASKFRTISLSVIMIEAANWHRKPHRLHLDGKQYVEICPCISSRTSPLL